MNSRSRGIITSSFALLVVLGILAPGCEPRFDGRTLDDWEQRVEAGTGGTEALDALEAIVASPEEDGAEGPPRREAARILVRAGEAGLDRIIGLLEHPDSRVRQQAGRALEGFGRSGREQGRPLLVERLPSLLRLLERFEEPVGNEATGGFIARSFANLKEHGTEVVPGLMDVLEKMLERSETGREVNPLLAKSCLMTLRDLGPVARDSIPLLYRLLEFPDGFVQEGAAEALEAIGPEAVRVEELLEIIENRRLRDGLRARAIRALARQEGEVEFLPLLLNLLADRTEDLWVRSEAADALVGFRSQDEDRIYGAILHEMRDDPDPEARSRFAYDLASFRSRAAEAAPIIAGDLEVAKDFRLEDAIETLGMIGPRAAPHVPRMLEILERLDVRREPNIILATARTLGMIGLEKKRAVGACMALIRAENGFYGKWAADSLRDLTPESLAVLEELREILKSLEGEKKEKLEATLLETIELLERERVASGKG